MRLINAILVIVIVVVPVRADLMTGVVGRWTFDDTSADVSGFGNPMSLYGPTFSSDFASAIGSGKSIQFTDTISYASSVSSFTSTAYTVSAWVKVSSNATFPMVIMGRTNSDTSVGGWSAQLRINSAGKFEHYTYDGASRLATGTTAVQKGVWYNVIGTSMSGGQMKLYVNGTLEATMAGTLGTLWAGGDRWNIGSPVTGFPSFQGNIDEVVIYNRAIASTEAKCVATAKLAPPRRCGDGDTVYNVYDFNADCVVDWKDIALFCSDWLNSTIPAPGLTAYWKFDEVAGTAASDSSGMSRNGTLINMPVWTSSGKVNGALQFDGVNDYVNITGYKGVNGTLSRTCTAWIKTSGSSAYNIILDWGTAVAGQKWMFAINPTGQLTINTWGSYIKTNRTVTDNQWHHVAAVLDGNTPNLNAIKLYVDGILEAATVSSAQAINTVSANDVVIGACDISGTKGYYFNGVIDDVRIYYNLALLDSEIADIANGSD